MKTVIKNSAQVPCLPFVQSSRFKVQGLKFKGPTAESGSVKPSQTQSNQIKPPLPLPVKKPVKKWPALRSPFLTILLLTKVVSEGGSSFWLFLTTWSESARRSGALRHTHLKMLQRDLGWICQFERLRFGSISRNSSSVS
jgi:hypothetical protein